MASPTVRRLMQAANDFHIRTSAGSEGLRIRILFIVFFVLIFAAFIANLAFTLTQGRRLQLENQYAISEKLVQVLEQQTADSINAAELALQSSARSIQLIPERALNRSEIIHEILVGSIRNLLFVRAIWVLDPEGNMIHDSERLPGKYNLADREYFKVHRDKRSRGLYIDRPMLSKHGVWFIGVSLRITRPDGSFGGVIAAAFEPKHFRQFYESIKIGKDGVVSLLGIDGTLMLRVPEIAGAEGSKFQPPPKFIDMLPRTSVGSYQAESSLDQIDRIYFFRRVAGRPLVVLVGVGEQDALAPWRSSAQAYVAISLFFFLLIISLAYLGLRELQRRAVLNKALVESEAALAAAQRLSRMGSWELDLTTQRRKWSDEMYAILGLQKTATPPPLTEFLSMLHPEDRHKVWNTSQNHSAWSGELRTNPANGPVRYLYAHGTELRDKAGQVRAIAGTFQDITERRLADEKLQLAARVFDHMQDGIVVATRDGAIMAVNDAFERITGFQEAEVLGQHPRVLRSDRHDRAFYAAIWNTLLKTGEWRGEIWGRRKNGEAYLQWMTISTIRDNQDRSTGYVGIFTDLSEIKEANAQLEFLADHDPLTRLPNRRVLNDRLQQAIEAAHPDHVSVAVLILNIDRLQRVNDSIGHDAGDAVLHETARRLLPKLRPGDTLARPGSDEFVVVLTQFEDNNDVITLAHQLRDAVTAPIHLHDRTISVTASVGIAIHPHDGENAGELLKNADAALSHAKQDGPSTLRFFTSEMNAQALHWISLEHSLRGALAHQEFSLYYQPQVCLNDGRMCGVEALLRWHSPVLGTVMPSDFIPIAEDTGLIVIIGEWVIHAACAQCKAWQDSGLAPIPVAVNVSGHQFMSGTLVGIVQDALGKTGLAPHYLEIELTETVLMRETESAIRQIAALRQLGVRVSLDDFGTGYSSLGYLSRFTLDKLKIDQCFVRNITSDPKSAAIAQATIALAHGLGITVIAEGVETDEQMKYLQSAGCDEIQGYLVGKPAPAEQIMRPRTSGNVLSPFLS